MMEFIWEACGLLWSPADSSFQSCSIIDVVLALQLYQYSLMETTCYYMFHRVICTMNFQCCSMIEVVLALQLYQHSFMETVCYYMFYCVLFVSTCFLYVVSHQLAYRLASFYKPDTVASFLQLQLCPMQKHILLALSIESPQWRFLMS
jgi:hypothetical protein